MSNLALSTVNTVFTRFDHMINKAYPNPDDDIYNEQLHLNTGKKSNQYPNNLSKIN